MNAAKSVMPTTNVAPALEAAINVLLRKVNESNRPAVKDAQTFDGAALVA
jgi:hypothetical protein